MLNLNSGIAVKLIRHCFIVFLFLFRMTSVTNPQEIENTKRKPIFILSVDPVGFLTLGPSVNGEIAFSDNFSLAAGYRQGNLGLLTGALFPDVESVWTVGLTLKYHFNNGERFTGFFFGPAVEIGKSSYEGELIYSGFNNYTRSEKSYDVLAYGGAIGYKWLFESGFSLEVSDLIGVVMSKRNDSFYKANEWNIDAYVLYMLSLKLGIAI